MEHQDCSTAHHINQAPSTLELQFLSCGSLGDFKHTVSSASRIAVQWIIIGNVFCVYRKFWQVNLNGDCGGQAPMWRQLANDSPHMLLTCNPTKERSTCYCRWTPRQSRLRTPCLGSPLANPRMSRSTSSFTRKEALLAGSTPR